MTMDDFRELKTGIVFRDHQYFCSLELALDLIGGKWKIMMLYQLRIGPLRSADLQRKMRGISAKVFTQTARKLENDGLLIRTVYPVVPPKVEYSLTELGRSVIPVIMEMGYWGERISEKAGMGACVDKIDASSISRSM